MTHPTQVLSDEQIEAIAQAVPPIAKTGHLSWEHAVARAIESATLDAARGQAVAWRISIKDEPDLGHWFSEEDCTVFGYISEPLYLHPSPTQPPAQAERAPVDERAEFEAWMTEGGKHPEVVQRYDNQPREYVLTATKHAWEVWQARAALKGQQ
jgi:hypothetical protein